VTLGRVGVIVAARMSSTRLPGKALLPLHGLPMIVFLLRRLRRTRLAEVVVATTNLPADDPLAETVAAEGVAVFRGSEADVVGRYVAAARHFDFDVVARVTADCPFVDAGLADWCIDRTAQFGDFDLTTTKGCFPVGLDMEIYRADCMEALDRSGKLTTEEREHLTLHFYNHGDEFAVRRIAPPDHWATSGRHFTVDTQDDYDDARRLVASIGGREFSIPAMLQMAQ
jgi:spore coat polysaccharide biosynthesis protein SpsF (cytidylyltransferase family)